MRTISSLHYQCLSHPLDTPEQAPGVGLGSSSAHLKRGRNWRRRWRWRDSNLPRYRDWFIPATAPYGGGYDAASSMPGTIRPSSMPVPGTPRTSNEDLCTCFLQSRFYVCLWHSTRMVDLGSLGTKVFRRHRLRLFKDPYGCSMEMEIFWQRRRPHGNRVITVWGSTV